MNTIVEICSNSLTMLELDEIESAVKKIVPHALVDVKDGLRVLICPNCGKGVEEAT